MAHRRCVFLSLVLAVIGGGWATSSYCTFELIGLFVGITLLLLAWCFLKAPLLQMSMVYFVCCTILLVRETVLTLSGRVPCGLVTFGDQCAETVCIEKHHILFFESGCATYSCARTERQEMQSVFAIPSENLHTVWLISGLACSWGAMLLSGRCLLSWMKVGPSDKLRHKISQYTSVVLLVPPTYSVCAISALRVITTNREDKWTAESMMDVAELFSAVALYSFQRLLVVYVDHLTPKDKVGLCESAENEHRLQKSFQSVMSVGIRQYVILAFGCNLMLVAVKGWDWLHPSSCEVALAVLAHAWFPRHNISLAVSQQELSQNLHTKASSLACEDVWNSASMLMVAADFFTCSIALFAILQYEHAFNQVLQAVRPFWKFWGVKGLLSVNFLQSSVLALVGLATAGDTWDTPRYVGTFLNYYLISAEAFLLAILNQWAYAPLGEARDLEATRSLHLFGDCMDRFGTSAST
ncbi:unnamed protein product [Effrenium voratum]|nr:unnamed protein product [Effrenium voratum]CAJ1454148.1 unnamed protein product [Effrenium voratum]